MERKILAALSIAVVFTLMSVSLFGCADSDEMKQAKADFTTQTERISSQEADLDAAISEGDELSATDDKLLDPSLIPALETAVSEAKAAKVEVPSMPSKLDDITAETRLLIGHRIDTAEQLFCYRDKVSEKITALTEKRKQLYKAQRTAAVKSDPEKTAEVKAQITALSKELAALRKEVVLCNTIAERSGVIKEKIKAVREDEQPERKEKTDHVQFR